MNCMNLQKNKINGIQQFLISMSNDAIFKVYFYFCPFFFFSFCCHTNTTITTYKKKHSLHQHYIISDYIKQLVANFFFKSISIFNI